MPLLKAVARPSNEELLSSACPALEWTHVNPTNSAPNRMNRNVHLEAIICNPAKRALKL